MNQNERERLEKGHQTAQVLLSDIREIHGKTNCLALEELAGSMFAQVASISRLLGRLATQK